jgi:hypothetical protein
VTKDEHRSAQPTVLIAVEQYLSARETPQILADPDALRGSELIGDIIYGVDAARALLTGRRR